LSISVIGPFTVLSPQRDWYADALRPAFGAPQRAVHCGAGAVWAAHGFRGELSRVDPDFDQVIQTLTVTSRTSAGSVQTPDFTATRHISTTPSGLPRSNPSAIPELFA